VQGIRLFPAGLGAGSYLEDLLTIGKGPCWAGRLGFSLGWVLAGWPISSYDGEHLPAHPGRF
jgi:hypothetical protein